MKSLKISLYIHENSQLPFETLSTTKANWFHNYKVRGCFIVICVLQIYTTSAQCFLALRRMCQLVSLYPIRMVAEIRFCLRDWNSIDMVIQCTTAEYPNVTFACLEKNKILLKKMAEMLKNMVLGYNQVQSFLYSNRIKSNGEQIIY